MKLRLHNYLQLSAVLTAMTMTGAYAQSAVSQSFTGTSLPSGFTTAANPNAAATAITFSSAGADFSGSPGGDNARNYIATSGTDYISGSFSASLNLINNSSDGAFFGLGNGSFGDSNEPGNGSLDSIYLRYTSGGAGIYTGGPFGSELYSFAVPNLGDPLTLGLVYNATADTLVFSITDNSTTSPSMQTSTPITISGNGTEAFTASNSAIFFGGSPSNNGLGDPVFTDLSITPAAAPEPPTWAFLALGLLLGFPLWRARRFSAQS
jgi:hypothetical protein